MNPSVRYFLRAKNTSGFTTFSLHERGFTLIELLVVIAVIGIIATGVITLIDPTSVFKRARDTQRKNDLKQIQSALQLFYNDSGVYPGSTSGCVHDPGTQTGGGVLDSPEVRKYFKTQRIPRDPLPAQQLVGTCYRYIPGSGNQSFTLCAVLENTSDPKTIANSGATDNCGGSYNYQITQ